MGTMEAREDLHLEFWNAPQRWAGPSHPHKDAGAEGTRVWGVMRGGWSFKAGGVCAEVWILWAQATLAVTEFSAGWNLVLNLVAVMETSSGTYVFKKVGNRPRTSARLLAGSVPFCSHSRAQQHLNLREVPFFWRLFLSLPPLPPPRLFLSWIIPHCWRFLRNVPCRHHPSWEEPWLPQVPVHHSPGHVEGDPPRSATGAPVFPSFSPSFIHSTAQFLTEQRISGWNLRGNGALSHTDTDRGNPIVPQLVNGSIKCGSSLRWNVIWQ